MKALAARTRDVDDLRLLAEMIGVDSAATAVQDMRRVLPRRGHLSEIRSRPPGVLRLTVINSHNRHDAIGSVQG
jgi:hypothetical protein